MSSSEAIAAAVAPVVTAIMTEGDNAAAIQNAINVASRPSWYAMTAKSDEEVEIRIYEDIGLFGVTAKRFADDLEKVAAQKISVRLNSFGGEAFDGIAIHNALRAHPATVTVHVDGIAASAASIVACAGDEVRMADNAFLMIHEARGGAFGESGDMRKYAELLDKLNDTIAGTYQQRAGKTRKHWRDRMSEQTWYTAEEAKAEGLVDGIDDREKAAENRFDFKVYNQITKVPPAVLAAWGKPQQQPAPEAVAPPDKPKESSPMSEPTKDAPAPAQPTPAGPTVTEAENRRREVMNLNATAIEGYLAQGHAAGHKDGVKAEQERCAAIIAACPGKPEMALDAIRNRYTPDTVAAAFAAATAADARARVELEKKDEEIARWRALNATGGYPVGVAMNVSNGDEPDESEKPTAEVAKQRAEQEWDRNPAARRGWSNKANFVTIRAAEMRGLLASN